MASEGVLSWGDASLGRLELMYDASESALNAFGVVIVMIRWNILMMMMFLFNCDEHRSSSK